MFVLDVTSKFIGPANQYDVSSSTSSSVAHKYLQVALVADENVAAKHGNHTADFLLVLANIVSSVFTVGESILSKHYCYASRHYITNSSLCFKIRTHRLSGFFLFPDGILTNSDCVDHCLVSIIKLCISLKA